MVAVEEPAGMDTTLAEPPQDRVMLSDPLPAARTPSDDLLSEAFIPSPMFENLIENQVRSDVLRIIAPVPSQVFQKTDTINFMWENGEEMFTLVVFNNKGHVVFEKAVGSPFRLSDLLQPGLYYWQLETEDEALQTYRFIVR